MSASKPAKPAKRTTTVNTAYFEVATDEDGTFHWCLWSANGRMMARNAASYERQKDVVQAIRNLQRLIPSVQLIVKTEPPEEAEQK